MKSEDFKISSGIVVTQIKINDKYIVYNHYNDRMIELNQNFKDNIPNNDEMTNPLYQFSYRKKPKHFMEWDIFKTQILLNQITTHLLFKPLLLIENAYFIGFLFSFTCLFTVYNDKEIIVNTTNTVNLEHLWNIRTILYFVISSLILTALHEFGHLAAYERNFPENRYWDFGFTLRYISIFTIFTSVPFMKYLPQKAKRKVIVAGIKVQFVIMCLTVISLSFISSTFLVMFYATNFSILLLNVTPFLKLDGYWWLSSIFSVEDYMEEYIKVITKKVKFKSLIFIFGTINILIIIFSIGTTVIGIKEIYQFLY